MSVRLLVSLDVQVGTWEEAEDLGRGIRSELLHTFGRGVLSQLRPNLVVEMRHWPEEPEPLRSDL